MQLHGVSMTTPNIMFGKKPNIFKKVTVFLKQIMFLFNSLKQTHNIYKTSIHPWNSDGAIKLFYNYKTCIFSQTTWSNSTE